MSIDEKYLSISFDGVGVRNSQKRLQGLINELAIEPLKDHRDSLAGKFEQVEDIVTKRIASVIAYWSEYKHDPLIPAPHDKMSEITNTSKGKHDPTLEDFYLEQVTNAMYVLSPVLRITVPEGYEPEPDELEYALLELEERFEQKGITASPRREANDYQVNGNDDEDDNDEDDVIEAEIAIEEALTATAAPVSRKEQAVSKPQRAKQAQPQRQQERAIVSAPQQTIVEVEEKEIDINVVNLTAQDAWRLIYNAMGYDSEYIQQTVLPRWQQYPTAFQSDRQFLYKLFIDSIQNYSGGQIIAGNFRFVDRELTIDQLWQHYYSDLSQKVAPLLTAARLEAAANDPWWKKLRQRIREEVGNISAVWLLALAIALIFDGLTTYISLDQTPMEGIIVPIFTVLITALFQIADQLVINYRKREFDADAMVAKYRAQTERHTQALENLSTSSESFVNLSMERSKSQANWKAAEDNRKMARRGRFWSARIADINVIVTAYGFAFLFLNSEEPVYALIQQIDYVFVQNAWDQVNLWVFLMVSLAITVSFVVNTAQRTEILGWSMRRMRKEG